MTNYPIPENEKERINALHNYAILDSLEEDEFNRITELASLICEMPVSLVSLIDENRQWFKSRFGMDMTETYRNLSFCQYSIMGTELFEVQDASQDPRFRENATVTGDPNIRFYAGVPLVDPNGYALGTLCVLDYRPNQLSNAQKKMLALLAQEVIALIVERRQKQELRQFEKIFTLTGDLICELDADGNFRKINPAFERLLGWKDQLFFNYSILELSHPEDADLTRQEIFRSFTTEETSSFTHRFRTRAGLYRTIQWTITPEKATGHLFAIGRDITDLQQTREMLEQTNQIARVGGWEFDFKTQKLHWTTVSHEMRGFDTDAVPGSAIEFYKAGEHRDTITNAISEAVTEGTSWDIELQIVNARSEVIWVRSIGHPEMENGQCKRLFGTFQDINDKKTAELQLNASRKLLDDILNAAWEVSIIAADLDGTITVFNSGAEKLLGYTAAEMIGRNGVDLFHLPDEMEVINRQLRENNGEQIEVTYVRKDGSSIKASLLGTVIKDDQQHVIGYLGISVDLSTIISQREELRIAKKQAEQASIAKSEFLANMSHEIRTPLNGVIGFTDLVLKTRLNETQQQYLTIVNHSANALLGIINDILDFSKIEAGKLELDIEKCDIYEMACQATDIITYPIQNKGLEMLLNISPDLPRLIWTDVVRLKQILINLLGNAAKFTERGEVELKISVLSFDSAESCLRFEIRDTGIGISLNKQEKIFEAFSQEDSSVTKKYGGTGLGLTISNKLLGLMGSKLQVRSSPGAGSCFYFDLTVKSEPGEGFIRKDMSLIKNALIVDDNGQNRKILCRMLEVQGIAGVEAKNGFEALQKLVAGARYDVILMDYHMPYMDGLETIRKIRESFYATADEQAIVLLYSSSDNEMVLRTCEELNVYHRLVKPVKAEDIYHILASLYKEKKPAPAVPVTKVRIASTATPLTILIAEDNPVNMLLIKTVLKRIAPHASVLTAVNGQEAVVQCEIKLPDLVLMDIQMPEMNGYEATTRIRALAHGGFVPIIAVTAGSLKSERKRCLDAGMDDIILKPFVEETIASVINRWLFHKF